MQISCYHKSLKECDYIDNKRITWILRVQRMPESNGLRDGYCGTFSERKTVKKSVRICKQHAAEAVKGGELKSITVEDT